MGDNRRHLVGAVAALVSLSLAFAGAVVMLTRSDLDLSGRDPLSRQGSDDGECYDMVRAASEAIRFGRATDARRWLTTAESLPCGRRAGHRIAQLYRELGDPAEAVRVLSSCESRGHSPDVLAELAGAFLDLGSMDSARVALRGAAMLPGPAPATVRSLAWTARALEEETLADSLFARSIRLFADDAELWRALASLRLQCGNINGSLHAATQAVALAPASCAARVALGWSQEAAGDTVAAAMAFDKAIRLCPTDSLALFEAGRFHHRGGRDTLALPFLSKATEAAWCPLEWLLMRAQAEQNLRKIAQARLTLHLACRRFDSDYRPFLALAKLERWHGDRTEAARLAAKARERAPSEPQVIRFLDIVG
ncbi:hypothetical protein JXA88_14460 [Candidatus Fermentibacteria bacterium]|nr:hypothetical protein [Candidatus Fermentibacteria bacterium]